MATGAAEHIDVTTADVFIPEVWSAEAIVAREQKLLFAEKVNRRHEKSVMSFGDLVHVPSVGNLAAYSKNTSANAATVYETITETNTNITIGTWHVSAIAIETATKRQVNRDLLQTYAPKMGYALGLAVDDVLASLPDDFSQVAGTLISELTYEDMLFAVQQLDDANVPQEDRVIIVSPAQKAGFMKLDQFIHADYAKINEGTKTAVKDSYLGTWMNVPVHFSTNVEGSNAAGHDNTIFHKEALALVVQMKPTTHTFFDVDYLAHKVVMEQLSGSAEMRDDHGVWLKGA